VSLSRAPVKLVATPIFPLQCPPDVVEVFQPRQGNGMGNAASGYRRITSSAVREFHIKVVVEFFVAT
jgi:hypothetical protein